MMTIRGGHIVPPYLFFDGRCEETLEFYCQALDTEARTLLRFKDNPIPPCALPELIRTR